MGGLVSQRFRGRYGILAGNGELLAARSLACFSKEHRLMPGLGQDVGRSMGRCPDPVRYLRYGHREQS
jgi:hypothetical protein